MNKKVINKNPLDRHPMLEQLSQLWRNKTAIAGLIIIVVFLLVAIFAPYISPHDPLETALYDQLKPPVWYEGGTTKNYLGTDDLGRDILSRLIYGARISLLVSVISVSIAFFFGTLIGAISGYKKGWIDNIVMRIMDIILSFPYILLAIVIVAYLGPGLENAMIAIGITYIPRFARIVRGSVLEECEKDYVTAARAIGANEFRIIFLAILPNCMGPLIVQTTLNFASAILDAAALSFLGLGAQPPTPEWGAMIAQSRSLILRASWVMTLPGLAILFAVLGFNLLGDGLRDALDPRLRD
ncbi:MAG: ABC transporter permease [Desulfobacula sp.]|jgi:peptide/nickel transport system permease protein/dipeptide transport system permease protein|uniref:ABC transporter permease n=1 Tax=Desulfobacula sp. TaxID=2593537 RepID=UPI001E0AE330|nr:ABC transporter permease [Desulfobacula sp.]MBT3486823.1 ABC transporter permease [Desulfobacula sp.]MBT3803435.1 ABC transporter permease [Desulfobacula sp.]MBT4024356.1 ABC transporter permease [Desulfobacula sp.]MBT4199667.1 ABC transporter permease [Desulfobacula sp.]